MGNKVLLILCDGMRSDSLSACGHPYVPELLRQSASTLEARSVFPSVTLPCHMSLFHSVSPDRHGILTNTYVPQVRPVEGLMERLSRFGKRCAMFYTWEPLRDLTRPGSLTLGLFASGRELGYEAATRYTAEAALTALAGPEPPDFTFLYLGEPDEGGHDRGWMSPEYLRSVSRAWDWVRRAAEVLSPGDTLLVTADHGGHGRSHGDDCPEDMTIPLLVRGPDFSPGAALPGDVSILDLAPTAAALLGVSPCRDWEGRSLFSGAKLPEI